MKKILEKIPLIYFNSDKYEVDFAFPDYYESLKDQYALIPIRINALPDQDLGYFQINKVYKNKITFDLFLNEKADNYHIVDKFLKDKTNDIHLLTKCLNFEPYYSKIMWKEKIIAVVLLDHSYVKIRLTFPKKTQKNDLDKNTT